MAYRIHTVSEMTGIPRNTLIAWERRYGFVKPERHDNSYRSYSDEDLAKLMRVKNAMRSGLSISEAIALLERDAKTEQDKAAKREAANENDDRGPVFHQLRTKLLAALIQFRANDAERMLTELLVMDQETRIHEIFFPILREIGQRWQHGEVTVVQEHFASAILRDQLVSMLVTSAPRAAEAQEAACTTFPGELHDLGALAMAVRLGHAGYRVTYLGPNLPAMELAAFCSIKRPKLVCVSAIVRLKARVLKEYADTVRGHLSSDVRFVVGGRGVDVKPSISVEGVELVSDWDDFDELESRGP